MTKDQLETLREGWDFEAKRAAGRDGRGTVPESLWETYSAMANTDGGRILLGALELKDGSLDLQGIVDVERVERELWDLLQNPQKVSANLLRREDVERLDIEGRSLLMLRVPRALRAQRPVFIKGSRDRGTYLRVHEGDRLAREDDVRRMIADSIRDRDSGAIKEFQTGDLDLGSVRRYREFFAARRADHPFLAQDDTEFLVSIGALRRMRESGKFHPTWAGLWMLGSETAIRELHPHWHLSFKELPADPDDTRRWLDRLHPDGTWNANLFQFYLRTIVKLHEGLSVPFAMEHGQFRVDETHVHDAIREAFVNSLVHADYQGTTGVRIVKRSAGFEFVNPGDLLVSPEQVWEGGVSEPRNPALQRLFGLLQLGEREGSGGPAMRRVWEAQHWRAPRIWHDVKHGDTHLEMALESLLPERAVRKLVQRWGTKFTGQDELGRVVLVTAEVEGSIQHARIRELSKAHPRDITLKLQELVKYGFLESSGRARITTYTKRGPSELPLFAATLSDATSTTSDATLTLSDATSALSDATSNASDATSALSDATSNASDATSTTSDATSTTSDQSSVLSQVNGNSRVAPEVLDLAILEVCANGFLSREQIASRVGRAVNTLRARFLPRLVQEGRLVLRYPNKPNHPAQAYRRNDDEDARES
jgi:predicted HTH transcriptional regulator